MGNQTPVDTEPDRAIIRQLVAEIMQEAARLTAEALFNSPAFLRQVGFIFPKHTRRRFGRIIRRKERRALKTKDSLINRQITEGDLTNRDLDASQLIKPPRLRPPVTRPPRSQRDGKRDEGSQKGTNDER